MASSALPTLCPQLHIRTPTRQLLSDINPPCTHVAIGAACSVLHRPWRHSWCSALNSLIWMGSKVPSVAAYDGQPPARRQARGANVSSMQRALCQEPLRARLHAYELHMLLLLLQLCTAQSAVHQPIRPVGQILQTYMHACVLHAGVHGGLAACDPCSSAHLAAGSIMPARHRSLS